MANNRRLIKFMTPDLGLALVRGYSGPVWRSTDAGISWSKVLDGCYTALATVPQAFVVAAGLEGSFATSQNAGETWVQVKLPVNGDIVAITASDPLNITITTKVRGESFERDRLYKENDSKLLISRDGGKRWTEISMPSGDFETRDLETTGAGKIWLLQAAIGVKSKRLFPICINGAAMLSIVKPLFFAALVRSSQRPTT